MNRILTTWRAMTGAERAVVAAAMIALSITLVAAAFALFKRPDDVSNPDAAFSRSAGAGKKESKAPKKKSTVAWPRFGYDLGRSKFLDAPVVRPPFRKDWKYKGDELIEFPPIVVGNRLYLIDNDGLYVALDSRTGKVVWKKRLSSLNASSPAVLQGHPLQRQPRAGSGDLAGSGERRQGALAKAAAVAGGVLAARDPGTDVLR